eukprot:CAMPEP_0170525614 /NCGR_PEP_ID=MMETSP0209-20121228/11056_1 /TAXON_ID=665100 ORGANISM="Litonotus pictus, Strain P1" /NCGR_SAMPLE_ID=MMETSP0209 /ASSEMBLY_ACC=CAM_ASM_000301 /LENGTH=94 /DNA_ID=CAMNT_0010814947 /DNA_START=32 /DNA_END=313 /DNA_ORIENTATION=+
MYLIMGASPMFEEKPRADIYHSNNDTTVYDIQLTKEICKDDDTVIKRITHEPGFSLSTEFEYYCDDVLNALTNACLFGGIVVALFLLSIFNDLW